MIILVLLLAGYVYGGAHSQDWNCLGPQPSLGGACTATAKPSALHGPTVRSILEQSDREFRHAMD